ncbi:MAG TPA: SIMPL domain-containing protein [Vicinamibacterales bacterium]
MLYRSLLPAVLLCAAIAVPLAAQPQRSSEPRPPEPDVVVTTGEATIKRAPDLAYVTVAAEARAKAPTEAQRTAAQAMTAVQEKLKAAGIGADAIRTLQYDLQPEFDYHDGRQTLRGYVARNTIEVRVDPVTRVGEVIDLTVQSGATSVSSLRFDLKAREEVEREALTAAVKNARARADAAAAGAGRKVAEVVRIEDHRVDTLPPPRPYMRTMAAEAAATPVQAGELEIKAQVTLTSRLQ